MTKVFTWFEAKGFLFIRKNDNTWNIKQSAKYIGLLFYFCLSKKTSFLKSSLFPKTIKPTFEKRFYTNVLVVVVVVTSMRSKDERRLSSERRPNSWYKSKAKQGLLFRGLVFLLRLWSETRWSRERLLRKWGASRRRLFSPWRSLSIIATVHKVRLFGDTASVVTLTTYIHAIKVNTAKLGLN